jgi:hypothetical protein
MKSKWVPPESVLTAVREAVAAHPGDIKSAVEDAYGRVMGLPPEEFQAYVKQVLKYHVALAVIDDGWPESNRLDDGKAHSTST